MDHHVSPSQQLGHLNTPTPTQNPHSIDLHGYCDDDDDDDDDDDKSCYKYYYDDDDDNDNDDDDYYDDDDGSSEWANSYDFGDITNADINDLLQEFAADNSSDTTDRNKHKNTKNNDLPDDNTDNDVNCFPWQNTQHVLLSLNDPRTQIWVREASKFQIRNNRWMCQQKADPLVSGTVRKLVNKGIHLVCVFFTYTKRRPWYSTQSKPQRLIFIVFYLFIILELGHM